MAKTVAEFTAEFPPAQRGVAIQIAAMSVLFGRLRVRQIDSIEYRFGG